VRAAAPPLLSATDAQSADFAAASAAYETARDGVARTTADDEQTAGSFPEIPNP
jgi:hypothetical protein